MDLRRPLLFGAVAVALTGTVVVAGASPSSGAVSAPRRSRRPSRPTRFDPLRARRRRSAALNIDNCALNANGTPADHGFPTPPFPTEEIVTTPITPEQWVPITIGATGPIVVLLQRGAAHRQSVAPRRRPVRQRDGHDRADRPDECRPGAERDRRRRACRTTRHSRHRDEDVPGARLDLQRQHVLRLTDPRRVGSTTRRGRRPQADPDISPVFEGFLADLRAGTLRIDEKSAYGFRCVATSSRNCAGRTLDQLSYHCVGRSC